MLFKIMAVKFLLLACLKVFTCWKRKKIWLKAKICMGQKFKNGWDKYQHLLFWSRMQCSIVDVLRRCAKSEYCWSNALIVKLSKQLLICSGGTSRGRGCVLTFVFYSQWSSLPSPLIGFKIIQNHADWKKHRVIREEWCSFSFTVS